MKKIYADLHSHTNHSDGLLEIEEVLKLAKDRGVEVLAITDHDTSNHFDQIKDKAKKVGIKTLKALEMSCYDYKVDKKVHIIALFMPEETPHIDKLCNDFLKRRDDNHRRLIKDLNKKGYDISYEACKKFSPYSIVFKSNIIQALKERYPEKADEITFKSIFGSMKDKSKNLKMGYIDVKEGIEAIISDGAIPIIAHPCQYENYSEIEKYVGYGLKGIEISHSKMKEEDYKITKDLAKKYDLLESGGTDFHNPKTLEFGKWGLSKEEFENLITRTEKASEIF